MQTISEVMTRDAQFISPHDSLQQAAKMMDDLNIGSLPVCDNERLIGILTDRDITVRATSVGQSPSETKVSEIMTDRIHSCTEDQSIEDVMQQMRDVQIRRIPVVDRGQRLIGIVALGDLATKQPDNVEQTLEEISSPSEPDRR